MEVTIFNVLMAILWSSLFIFISNMIWKNTALLLKVGIFVPVTLMLVGLLRMFLTIELPNAIIIRSWEILPYIRTVLEQEFFTVFGRGYRLWHHLIAMWATTSTWLLFYLFSALVKQTVALSKTSEAGDSVARMILQAIVDETAPGTRYVLLESSEVTIPMMTGFFVPKIILPTAPMTEQELSHVLQHEWNHYLHHDMWAKLLLNILTCLLWWNPLVHYLQQDFDHYLEVHCDRQVTKDMSEIERLAYVETTANMIKNVLKRQPKQFAHVVSFASSGSKMKQRCAITLAASPPVKSQTMLLICITTVVLVFLLSFMFVFQPAIEAPPPIDVDNMSFIEITPDNSYITKSDDQTYKVFYKGVVFCTISEADLLKLPFSELPVNQ